MEFLFTPLGLGLLCGLVLAGGLAGPGIKQGFQGASEFWRARLGKNGNGHGHAIATPQKNDSGPSELPIFMTRDEGEELEKLVRDRTHDANNAAQKALSSFEGIDRRVDKHSRILMDVQSQMAEHRGETRARLEAVREKQEESCERLERVEQQQSDSGTLLKAVAQKLGVAG